MAVRRNGPIRDGRCRQARAILRGLGIAATSLALANCAGPQATRKRASNKDYGVVASPRVIPEGQPIPKGGGRDMVGKPYVVGGRTYVPHPGKGYDREGWASWYGDAFHGRLTANGEVFDRQSIAAAHPTLPLPSYVRVTNLSNQRSMIVRVNDRGPYEQGRVIDLSEAAATALDFRRKGTTRVRVEFAGKASTNGSDDTKLLATLTTDGRPAHLGRSPPVMVAEAPEPPVPRAAPIRMADAGPVLRRTLSDEADTLKPPPRPARPAVTHEPEDDEVPPAPSRPAAPPARSAMLTFPPAPAPVLRAPPPVPAAASPMSILPPDRPSLVGIYFADPKAAARPAGKGDPFLSLKRTGTVPLKGAEGPSTRR